MTTTRTHPAFTLALFASAITLGGCVVVSESNPTPQKAKPVVRDQTAPARVAVSPLTRAGMDQAGKPAVFLHLDFRDANEKSIKAFGQLHVELHQPGADKSLQQSWDADLNNAVYNALSFDEMITRTYTINLSAAPEWLVRWSRKEGDAAAAPAPTLEVQFAPAGATSNDQILKASYTLTR